MDERKVGRGQSYTAFFFVAATGLLGVMSAVLIYVDASSKGEQYLEDSLWIIYVGLAFGIISLLFSIYILLRGKEAS
jgi:hypothetical protein